MIGTAGDIIFFDTNVPHMAGIVEQGYKRRVLRFDFELDGLNKKPSFFDRVKNKILRK